MNTPELTEIVSIPEFESKVEEFVSPDVLSKITPDQRWLMDRASEAQQRSIWLVERVVFTHNLSISNAKQVHSWRMKYESPIALAKKFASLTFAAFVGAYVTNWLKTK